MRALKLFTDRPPEYGQVSNRRWLQSVIHITSHRSTELDLRTGCEAFCQRNVHKPRLIPLSVAAVVQIHALWCALSLPPRVRRCCHQSRPTAQLAADRAVEEPCPTRSTLRANTQSPNRANVLRFLASHALGTCDFSPDVARFMPNRQVSNPRPNAHGIPNQRHQSERISSPWITSDGRPGVGDQSFRSLTANTLSIGFVHGWSARSNNPQ